MSDVTMTSNTEIQYFHWILWSMMIHLQTMLGFRRITASEDIAETVIIILIIKAFAMTFTLKTAIQFFLQDILVHDDVPP